MDKGPIVLRRNRPASTSGTGRPEYLEGLTDKGIVQLTHIVSDFSSYNTLNLALDTDYDYRDFWKELAGFTASS